jgi:hypothetical protein
MPYVFYKGAFLTEEEYEKLKDKLDQKEQEYLKLLLGEDYESKEDHEGASPSEASEASEEPAAESSVEPVVEPAVEPLEPVDVQEVHPNVEGGEKSDSGEPEPKQVRRKRQR